MSGLGVVSAESRNFCQASPTKKKKKHQKSMGPGPSCPSPQYEKVQNIITKRGFSEGPLAQAPEASALALPCPGHRVRRGQALG